jgi:hypothetical protein
MSGWTGVTVNPVSLLLPSCLDTRDRVWGSYTTFALGGSGEDGSAVRDLDVRINVRVFLSNTTAESSSSSDIEEGPE